MDHLGIHLMIAGTGTLHMQVLPCLHPTRTGWALQALWGLLALGVLHRLIRGDASSGKLSMGVYVLMACTMLVAFEYSRDMLEHPTLLLVPATLFVYGFSAVGFFLPAGDEGRPREERERLHAYWHVGTVVGAVLAGLAIPLA